MVTNVQIDLKLLQYYIVRTATNKTTQCKQCGIIIVMLMVEKRTQQRTTGILSCSSSSSSPRRVNLGFSCVHYSVVQETLP